MPAHTSQTPDLPMPAVTPSGSDCPCANNRIPCARRAQFERTCWSEKSAASPLPSKARAPVPHEWRGLRTASRRASVFPVISLPASEVFDDIEPRQYTFVSRTLSNQNRRSALEQLQHFIDILFRTDCRERRLEHGAHRQLHHVRRFHCFLKQHAFGQRTDQISTLEDGQL